MLLDIPGTLKLERIHSNDAKSEDWYDQSEYEWVMIVSGSASLRFEDSEKLVEMRKGDFTLIEPHRRHKVENTDSGQEGTIWLALFYSSKPLEL